VIHGAVVDEQGRAVEGARVAIVDAPAPSPDVALLTGPDGEFVLGAQRQGRYRIAVHADGYESAEATVDVVADQPATVRLELSPVEQE
jgi:Carboxypeptidase regulatory-like domain